MGFSFDPLAKSSNLLNISSGGKSITYPTSPHQITHSILKPSNARDQSSWTGGESTYQRQGTGRAWPLVPQQGVWDRGQGLSPPPSPLYHADCTGVPASQSFPRPATLLLCHIPISISPLTSAQETGQKAENLGLTILRILQHMQCFLTILFHGRGDSLKPQAT